MTSRLKTLLLQLLRSPRRFPVEAAMGIIFFIIAVWDSETSVWNEAVARMESDVNGDILWLFVPLVALSFWLQRVNRWTYLASFFLFLPIMVLDLKPFLWTYGFAFTYVLAAILIVVGSKKMDNRTFAAHALHVGTQMFFGVVVTGLLTLAAMAIIASFFYIFGIDAPKHFYEHIIQFIWFVLAPQICCTLIRQDEDEVGEPAKVLRIIIDYILSPAIIIYTVILYIYFIKIAVEWDLPKGGVAWMVMGFITAALTGHMAQSILSRQHFDWFYRHFSFIAIPPLIMYWIGSIYRIRLYDFTESRFYLMVAGVLMTLFVLMLFCERTRRYQLMALITAFAIILFTYIPGISAKDIGLRSQKQRLTAIISELKLTDANTGKLNDNIDLKRIKQDSLMCETYRDATSVISYVRHVIGDDEFKKQYGEWKYSEYDFNYRKTNDLTFEKDWFERKEPVDVGEYSQLMAHEKYLCKFDGQAVNVQLEDGPVVLTYPINDNVKQDPDLLHHPEQLFTFSNDSLMLVLDNICINDTAVTDVRCYEYKLFKKQ